jgi:hypothetical protein
MRSISSVVPMNCVSGLVPAFPESDQPLVVAGCQLALPRASVVRTYPDADPVMRRNPENEPVPATSRRYDGVVVQIPIFALEPRISVLD